jgi:hypothetical protein
MNKKGKIIITCMDGNKLYESLKDKNQIEFIDYENNDHVKYLVKK